MQMTECLKPIPRPLKLARIYASPVGRDPRIWRTIDFFARKGFIRNSPLPRPYRGLLSLDDVLWACAHAIPELYEMVPAARLKFPKHLLGRAPDDLRAVLNALRANEPRGPAYHGHAFPVIAAWIDFATTDGRASARLTKRTMYKLPPALAWQIKTAAAAAGLTASDLVIRVMTAYVTAPRRP